MVARLLHGLVQLQYAPNDDFQLSFTPVDQVVQGLMAIAHSAPLSLQQAKQTPVLHMAQTHSISLQDVVLALRQQGYAIATVSYKDWFERLQADFENPLYPLLDDLAPGNSCPTFFKVLDLSQVCVRQFRQQLRNGDRLGNVT